KLIGPKGADIWVSTFHSMCVRILRRDIERLGYTSNFSILDSADQQSVLKNCLKDLNIDAKKFDPRMFQSMIGKAKNELVMAQCLAMKTGDYLQELAAKVYTGYQRRLKSSNSLDFDDLIMLTIQLFEEAPELLDFYQKKFKYIHVVEYQETIHSQYILF